MKITVIFLLFSGVCAWPKIFGKMGPMKSQTAMKTNTAMKTQTAIKSQTKRSSYWTIAILRTHFQLQRLKELTHQRISGLKRSRRLQNQVLSYLARRN